MKNQQKKRNNCRSGVDINKFQNSIYVYIYLFNIIKVAKCSKTSLECLQART